MAAKIGILGESTTATAGTVTVYTVPADKSARIRILLGAEQASVGTLDYTVLIGSPGSEITLHERLEADVDLFTGSRPASSPDPATSILSRVTGLQSGNTIMEMTTALSTAEWMRTPLAADFFLSTGDTVKFTITTRALGDHLFQVLGVEDDA